ncbi:MAG: hypothetical protein C0498_01575 [Anaerolinea sp.]|nr:hypothetical protein [Anaerolinea sp.]
MSGRWTRWDRAPVLVPPNHQREPVLPDVPGLRVDVLGRPPTWNHAYRRLRDGRVVLTPEARWWKEGVATLALDAVNRTGWRPVGPLHGVYIWLYIGAEMDGDNATKLTLDGLARGLRVNDRTFLPRLMGKWTGEAHERVVLYVVNEGRESC